MFENPPKKSADMVNTRGGSSIRPPPSKLKCLFFSRQKIINKSQSKRETTIFSNYFFPPTKLALKEKIVLPVAGHGYVVCAPKTHFKKMRTGHFLCGS